MDRLLMSKQIAASVLSQDQLVMSYRHRDDSGVEEDVVRFVTPIELNEEDVLCCQHLPEEGYRRFKLQNIKNFHRVLTRNVFSGIDKDAAKKGTVQDG